MNIDDPKLTAHALDELDEAERAAIADEVAASPAAQREIQETQTMARLLRKEFVAEFSKEPSLRANLSDIRDDPWFWSIARPLAATAAIAIFAVIGLAIFGSYKLHQNEIAQASRRPTNLPLAAPSEIEAETATAVSRQRPAAAQLIFAKTAIFELKTEHSTPPITDTSSKMPFSRRYIIRCRRSRSMSTRRRIQCCADSSTRERCRPRMRYGSRRWLTISPTITPSRKRRPLLGPRRYRELPLGGRIGWCESD